MYKYFSSHDALTSLKNWSKYYKEANNFIQLDGTLPELRVIDLSKFRGTPVMTVSANVGPDNWITYEVDGKIILTLTANPGIYNNISFELPNGSSSLTISIRGNYGNIAKGVRVQAVSTFVRGWLKEFNMYHNY